jgi:hypothetical protein
MESATRGGAVRHKQSTILAFCGLPLRPLFFSFLSPSLDRLPPLLCIPTTDGLRIAVSYRIIN